MPNRRPLHSLIFLLAATLLLPPPGTLQAAPIRPNMETVPADQPLSAGAGDLVINEDGRVQVVIELSLSAGALIWAREMEANRGLGKDAASRAAASATRSHLATVAAQQEDVLSALSAPSIDARVIYRVQRVLNAIAVAVRPEALPQIARLPGVRSIRPLVLEYPTNSTSVPFLGTPKVWENTLGLPFPATGTGITIGIIDTGIDYQHPHFGGTGVLADYQANDRTTLDTGEANVQFPTAKVVGGFDFAGDAYSGGATPPAPDPDPMDCNGHGSHVAGTAAGFGVVDATDTTYPGPYNTAVPFGTLSIGPGTAPQAQLYGLRVFGCGGGTGLTVQAIDWSTDPNDDGDFSDHLDVINMSLSSTNGGVNNATTIASENASLVGVIVVGSAGNSGDTYFIVGSPSVSNRTISVANVADSGISGSVLQINSPAGAAGSYPALPSNFANNPPPNPPAPSGQTATVVVVNDGTAAAGGGTLTDGCETPFANAAAVAGNIALVDRGLCGFEIKVRNAQINGAIAVIVGNNVPNDPTLTSMGCTTVGGCSPVITVPSVFVSQATANTIKAQVTAVNGTLNGPAQGINNADVISASSSRGPRRASSPMVLKPDVAAPGTSITSTQSGIVCTGSGAGNTGCLVSNPSGFIPGGAPLVISGTSMAAPHIAGIMALLRQLHPEWDVEELKALLMNNAVHDASLGAQGSGPHIGTSRNGAGRTNVELTAPQLVTAFNDDEYGLVSTSFSQRDIVGSATEVKTIRVVNHGVTSQTYDLAVELPQNADGSPVNDAPGVSFSIAGGQTSVTVPAGGTATIDVQMSATASSMNHVREASVAPTQTAPAPFAGLGNLARSWLTEEAGHLTFRQGGNLKLRVPLYSSARPASQMASDDTLVTGGAPTGSGTLSLEGTDVCTGTLSAGPPNCTGSFPTTVASLVTPFELQFASPLDAVNSTPSADLQYGGVSFDNNNTPAVATDDLILFGFSTWGSWSSMTDVAINVCIDFDENGVYDRMLVNSNAGTLAVAFGSTASPAAQDTFIRGFLTIPGGTGGSAGGSINLIAPNFVNTRMLDNNVMFMGATPAQLLLPTGDTTFRWKAITCPGFNPLCGNPACNPAAGTFFDQAPGPYFFNYAARGLDFGPLAWLLNDLDGSTIPVAWNTANLTTNGSLGGLLLHHHNVEGERAEVFAVASAAGSTADLRVSNGVTGTQSVGSDVTFTVTVTNDGPATASGVLVGVILPNGLTYVSDNGSGAYNSGSGVWTVPGTLANGASATLQVVATIDVIDEACTLAQISAGTPLDGDPSDNQATVCVAAPRESDLAVEISANANHVAVGDPVTFTIDLDNLPGSLPASSQTAFGVSATVSFPGNPGLAMSGTPTEGTFNNATGVWTLASLAPGGSRQLTVTVNAPNTDVLQAQVTVTSSLNDPDTANNTDSTGVSVGSGLYYTVTPCRLVDTRNAAGPYGGPALVPNAERDIDAVGGSCGIPSTASAIALNVTVFNSSGSGNFRLYEDGIATPTTSTLNFALGQTRANNAIIPLTSGVFTIFNSSVGSNHALIDIVGYVE